MKKIINLITIVITSLVLLSGCSNQETIGHFEKTGELNQPRVRHRASLMKNGNVLITGGTYGWQLFKSAEIYLTKEGKFVKTGDMFLQRRSHISIALPDGRVAITGGTINQGKEYSKYLKAKKYKKTKYRQNPDLVYSDLVEIYDPQTGKFEDGGRLTLGGTQLKAVLMQDGRIFIMGGIDPERRKPRRHVEIYDPKTKSSKVVKSQMHYFRRDCALTVLKDGRILITGGKASPLTGGRLAHTMKPYVINGIPCSAGGTIESAEIYDPKKDEFILVNDMNYKRAEHSSILLPDGNVLIVGGESLHGYRLLDKEIYDKNIHSRIKTGRNPYGDMQHKIQDIELFDPKTNEFKVVGKLNHAIDGNKLSLLNNRYVLVMDGLGKAEEIIDITDFKTYPTKRMNEKKGLLTATKITEDKVLLAGGYFRKNIDKNTAEIFVLDK